MTDDLIPSAVGNFEQFLVLEASSAYYPEDLGIKTYYRNQKLLGIKSLFDPVTLGTTMNGNYFGAFLVSKDNGFYGPFVEFRNGVKEQVYASRLMYQYGLKANRQTPFKFVISNHGQYDADIGYQIKLMIP